MTCLVAFDVVAFVGRGSDPAPTSNQTTQAMSTSANTPAAHRSATPRATSPGPTSLRASRDLSSFVALPRWHGLRDRQSSPPRADGCGRSGADYSSRNLISSQARHPRSIGILNARIMEGIRHEASHGVAARALSASVSQVTWEIAVAPARSGGDGANSSVDRPGSARGGGAHDRRQRGDGDLHGDAHLVRSVGRWERPRHCWPRAWKAARRVPLDLQHLGLLLGDRAAGGQAVRRLAVLT
jgi:hypothetical protein